MVFHPPGIVVEIIGIEAGDQGRSCKEHPANCGEMLEPDVVVRLLKVQLIEGREVTAIAAVWVTDGIDRCQVGFIKRNMVKHAAHYKARIQHAVTRQNGGCTTTMGGAASQQSSPACLWLAA
jgi:hypothetical protein